MGPDDPDDILDQLIRPSVLALPLLSDGRTLLDAGTGVGIPGLPLALLASARPVHLVEPKTQCHGLVRWLLNQLPPLSVRLHAFRLEELPFERFPSVQVVTRSALDWDTLDASIPSSNGPIIRWSGPDVNPPPNRTNWLGRRLRVHMDRFHQEFFWWGPKKLFHVKQFHWSNSRNFTVSHC